MGRVPVETPPQYPPQPQPQPQPQPIFHQNVYYQPGVNGQQPVGNYVNGGVPQVHPQSSPVLTSMPTNFQSQNINPPTGFTPMQRAAVGTIPSATFNGANFTNTVPWTTGLFDCNQDPQNAFITAFFPCITFGQIADVLDSGHTTCVTSGIIYASAPCLLSRPYRTKLRQRFGLIEAPAADWIVHTMFEPCALCQEYRELVNRGIDPALGYHGNLNKNQADQQGGATMMIPPKNQMMN